LRTENDLLGIDMLDLLPLGSLSSLDGLPDGLADLLAEELPEELVTELGLLGHEGHAARVARLFRGESDTGRGGLDVLSIPVLGVDTDTDELGPSDGADEVLRGLLIISVVDLFGQVELERDVTSLDGTGVGDVDVAAGDRLVEANMGSLVGKRQGERDICALLKRHAGDRVRLDDTVHLRLGNEETRDGEEYDEGHDDPQELPGE